MGEIWVMSNEDSRPDSSPRDDVEPGHTVVEWSQWSCLSNGQPLVVTTGVSERSLPAQF